MNSVNLTGRLTRDPEVRYTDGGTSIARFSVAVDRKFTQENGPKADFPNCVAFGKTAEFIEKWFAKGMKIEITGRIQTGSYKIRTEILFTQQMWLRNKLVLQRVKLQIARIMVLPKITDRFLEMMVLWTFRTELTMNFRLIRGDLFGHTD